nr:Glycosyl hydrolase family 10 [uncultured organism]
MTTRRTMLAGMAATAGGILLPAGFGARAATQASSEELARTPLKDIARRKGMTFGTAVAVNPTQYGNPAYRALVERECNIIVAENEMKWQYIEPAEGKLNFGGGDTLLKWATEKNIELRGHNMFWAPEKWLPVWLTKKDFGAKPAQAVEQLTRAHVKAMADHFGKAVRSWDVVNEAVEPETGLLRDNSLNKHTGKLEHLDLTFRAAREFAPHAQLVYNDYMRGDAGSAKHRAGVLKMLEDLKKRGTPVDAVGLQSHIGSWDETDKGRDDLVQWRKFLDELTAMGYDLLITEFDVNDRRLPADIAKRDAGVAALTKDYLDLTLSYPNLHDFLLWGMTDDVSWLQTWYEAPRLDKLPMRPLPYDGKGNAKPMRAAIAAAIEAAPVRKPKKKA